jgi:hypothetical protein
VPGKRGPKVFQWVLVNGFRIRTPVDHNHVEFVWDDYGPTQMIYDSINDEWDLCEEFDPFGKPPSHEDWDDEEPVPIPTFNHRLHEKMPDPPGPPDEPRHSQDLTVRALVRSEEPLDAVLYYRFGFFWHDHLAVVHPGPIPEREWFRVLKLLADDDTPIDPLKKPAIAAFITDPSGQHLDPSCLATIKIKMIKWRESSEDVYLLGDGKTDDTHWQLTVEDPLHVMECARRRLGPGPVSIARYLLSKGIAFNTWMPIPNQLPPPVRRPTTDLALHTGMNFKALKIH